MYPSNDYWCSSISSYYHQQQSGEGSNTEIFFQDFEVIMQVQEGCLKNNLLIALH
jgi:hypothetical protein